MWININNDGTDASRRAIGWRITIRLLSGASRLAIKRLQQTVVPRASSLVRQPLIRQPLVRQAKLGASFRVKVPDE